MNSFILKFHETNLFEPINGESLLGDQEKKQTFTCSKCDAETLLDFNMVYNY